MMKKILMYSALALLVSCGSNDDKKAQVEEKPQGPLVQSKNSDSFNESFGKLMDNYIHLKDNFITESDSLITYYAQHLKSDVDSLPLNELKADTSIVATAKQNTQSISSELKGLLGEKTLEGKRKSFQMVGNELYDLIRAVQYDKEVIYHQFCPMAFNDQGANWLSRTSDIKNPYLPKKMLTCGEVQDSIDYRKK